MTALPSITADLIMLVHLAFIVFVIGGELCIIVGYFLQWRWVRHLIFRVGHLVAIGIVVLQAWANRICPLTLWENRIRHAAGEAAYSETFIQHWVGRLIYYDAPAWAFTFAYTVFGVLVLVSWIWIRPRSRKHTSPAHDTI
jgi:hypothetical protein